MLCDVVPLKHKKSICSSPILKHRKLLQKQPKSSTYVSAENDDSWGHKASKLSLKLVQLKPIPIPIELAATAESRFEENNSVDSSALDLRFDKFDTMIDLTIDDQLQNESKYETQEELSGFEFAQTSFAAEIRKKSEASKIIKLPRKHDYSSVVEMRPLVSQ